MNLAVYLKPLVRMWWLILAAVIAATVASFVVVRRSPPTYQSHTVLMVGRALESPNPNSGDLYMSQQLAGTYVDILKRDQIQNSTMVALGLDWLPAYTANLVYGTQFMELVVTDIDPLRAQAVARELANQLMRLTPTNPEGGDRSRQAFVDQQLDELEASIKATREEISKKQAELATMFSARQIADTQAQIAALQSKLSALQANYAALIQGSQRAAINTITVVEPATLPLRPIGPNKYSMVLMAAAIGFVLAAAGAYLLDYLDDTMKNPTEVQAALGLATLGAVPRMNGPSGQGTLLPESPLPVIESYSVLRTNLQFAAVGQPLRSLLITSSVPGEGKSLTAANLSIALAQSSQRVILVDGDLRRPRLHKLFHLGNAHGVTTALLQDPFDLESLLQETEVPGLRVLAAGPVPPNPAQLLSSGRMRELVAELQAATDILIVDSPPATAFADAALLSTQVSGVLLVIDAGRTRRDIALKALDALKHVSAPILGALLNRIPRSAADYYYYYYYYEDRKARSTRRSDTQSPVVAAKSARKSFLNRQRTAEPEPTEP
jgi:succinoglycan biosynthesis transport protein ExoP